VIGEGRHSKGSRSWPRPWWISRRPLCISPAARSRTNWRSSGQSRRHRPLLDRATGIRRTRRYVGARMPRILAPATANWRELIGRGKVSTTVGVSVWRKPSYRGSRELVPHDRAAKSPAPNWLRLNSGLKKRVLSAGNELRVIGLDVANAFRSVLQWNS